MRKQFKWITIFLALIFLLPVLFFSAYELFRMNKSEEELQLAYNRQLDAILFSINLYSEDIMSSWALKIRTGMASEKDLNCDNFKKLLSDASSIKTLVFIDATDYRNINACSLDSSKGMFHISSELIKLFNDSSKKLNRLKTYYKAGYNKIEQLGSSQAGNSKYITFLTGDENSHKWCIIEIAQDKFIRDILGQKIQRTAEDKLKIGIVDNLSKKMLYSYGELEGIEDFTTLKPIWLFPQYSIGITPRDKSIDTLSKERNKFNLILIIVADIIFLTGGFLIFRNLRKEMKLTQIKSDFISNVSHEIRTPLALISMYAETLEMDRVKNEEKKKEYYSVILSETQRLSVIVNRILNFSKMESGKRVYNFTTTDINKVVEQVMRTYGFHLKNKGFTYNISLTPDLPNINADAEALSEVIINLIDNAIKYSTENKHIDLNTDQTQNQVIIEVRDKGVGISSENQKFVFEKFFRVAKGDLAYAARGTGLGLTIVKNIVDAHNGRIELSSSPGQGSSFKIVLNKTA